MFMMCVDWFFVFLLCVFFFKQKTAYEMRISDWSSDVCSSDLLLVPGMTQCRDCHVGESGVRLAKMKVETATASPCAMCHEYTSDGGKQWVQARQRRQHVKAITGADSVTLYSAAGRAPGAGGGGACGRAGGGRDAGAGGQGG